MAKGIKTGGRDFLPSNTANLKGRPKTPEEIRQLQNYTRSEINRVFHALVNNNTNETFRIKHDPNATILEIGIAKVLEAFALYGDMNKFNQLAAHCGLALPKNVELPKIEDGTPQTAMSAEELTKIVLYIRQLRKEKETQKVVSSESDN